MVEEVEVEAGASAAAGGAAAAAAERCRARAPPLQMVPRARGAPPVRPKSPNPALSRAADPAAATAAPRSSIGAEEEERLELADAAATARLGGRPIPSALVVVRAVALVPVWPPSRALGVIVFRWGEARVWSQNLESERAYRGLAGARAQ